MTRNPRTAVLATFLGDLTLAVAKFIAATLAQSATLLAESVHSTADAGSQVLLLLGAKVVRRPPEVQGTFAFARARYYWGSMVVLVVCTVGGAFSIHAGLRVILAGGPMTGSTGAGYGALGIAVVFVAFSMHGALREFLLLVRGKPVREAVAAAKDPTVPMTLLEDAASALGLVVAIVGLAVADATGRAVFDGAAAVVVGLILAGRAAIAAHRARRFLLGDAAARGDHERIRRILALQPGIERVTDVSAIHLAPDDVVLGLTLECRADVGADDLERIVHNMDYRIREALPHAKRVYIEAGSVVRFLQKTRRSGGTG